MLNVKNLIEGVYEFALTVTDNTTAKTSDTLTVRVYPDPATMLCNNNAPVTHYLNYTTPGEIYRPNAVSYTHLDVYKRQTQYTSFFL